VAVLDAAIILLDFPVGAHGTPCGPVFLHDHITGFIPDRVERRVNQNRVACDKVVDLIVVIVVIARVPVPVSVPVPVPAPTPRQGE